VTHPPYFPLDPTSSYHLYPPTLAVSLRICFKMVSRRMLGSPSLPPCLPSFLPSLFRVLKGDPLDPHLAYTHHMHTVR
jgi:hypothetical protein